MGGAAIRRVLLMALFYPAWSGWEPVSAQHEGHGTHAPRDTVSRPRPTRPRAAPVRRTPTSRQVRRPSAAAPSPHAGHGPSDHSMPALLGAYSARREASGTAWQPELAPHAGRHGSRAGWHGMLHGSAQMAATSQGGGRGDRDLYANHMIMGMAVRELGRSGPKVGLRAMLSLEPATIGRHGYPLLLQTGETADGREHLIDRQHPHDLFMELAGTFSVSSRSRSGFLYAALAGEPALGPPVFMHRFSGEVFPDAPITHHWLDSSHITFGVLTAGLVMDGVKLEGSAFRGREPDQHRWNLEEPRLDSHSLRASWNPGPAWALQVSHGRLESPEQLEPEADVRRTTASVMHHVDRRTRALEMQTVLAFGRNELQPGPVLDAWLLESHLELHGRHHVLARVERAEKNELFHEDDPRHGHAFTVGRVAAGYLYEGWRTPGLTWGAGVLAAVCFVPGAIEDVYDHAPLSGTIYVSARLR